MTDVNAIKEAIDALTCGLLDVCDIEPYMGTILEALEKQMPRTPIVDIYGDLDCMCPTCYRVFKNLKKGKMSAYCPDCGQTLLWENIE